MKILLTPEQERTILSVSRSVYEGHNYYFFPFFFKDIGMGVYDQLTWDELPEPVKDQILRIRGIKLPIINDETTEENR